jgi:hypothetical protein
MVSYVCTALVVAADVLDQAVDRRAREGGGVAPMRVRRLGALRVVACVLVVGWVAGCASSDGSEAPVERSIPVFSTPAPAPDRVSEWNDETSFEPCVHISAADLAEVGVDPATWTDISMSEGPRGCRAVGETGTFTALVINGSVDLLYAGRVTPPGLTVGTTMIDGRTVTHHRFDQNAVCVASVPTGSATLSVSLADTATPTRAGLCERADAVLRDVLTVAEEPDPTPTVFSRHIPSAVYYTILIQWGVIPAEVPPPGIRLLDEKRRLLPASTLRRENPQSSTLVSANLIDLVYALAR